MSGIPRRFHAVFFALIASALFTGNHVIVKLIAGEVHPFEIAFFRCAFGLLFLVPWFLHGGMAKMRTSRIKLFAFRGFLNAIAMMSFFTALSLVPLAEITAISFTAPLFATLMAILILKETVGWRRWLALFAGIVGMLVIVRPGFDELSFGLLLAIFASATWGFVTVVVKKLTTTESSVAISAYMMVFMFPITLLFSLPYWTWPDIEALFWMAAIAGMATFAQVCLAEALKYSDASAIVPYDFTRLLWAALWGILFFSEVPDIWLWTGGVIIFTSTVFIARREAQLKKAAHKDGNVDGAEPSP
ncbi:MAG: DMT family transporter [Rhodospirillales bacterium]|nr:DMT family transporter [Rhodospirillales bacterium]